MPNKSGNNEVSRLINTVGMHLNTNYNCDGSSAYIKDIPQALKILEYKSAKHKKYDTGDYNLVVKQINMKLPVILGGAKDSGWGVIGIYPDGQAWVCDGYTRYKVCKPNGGFTSSLFFHMNWGWDNGLYNGWFGHGNWNPQRDNEGYNNRPAIIYDIKP